MSRLTARSGPLLVGLVAVLLCAAQAAVYGWPVPSVHDEFSYLLAADTFAHGRCANPPHPLWPHFETMHVLPQPAYASKYPPGQGLFLAAGQLLGGHAAVGVWLGMGLACGAATWMLRAFVPAQWAVVGGLLMAARLCLGYWGWSYWGGGVAAAGGALFVGGWARAVHRQRPLPAAVMSAGLVLLAVSRPFEGLVLCLPFGLATPFRLARSGRTTVGVVLRGMLAPAVAVLVPGALAVGYYNWRVTGSAVRLPYVEHAARYDSAPPLVVQAANPEPDYRHPELRDFHRDFEFRAYKGMQDYDFWVSELRARVRLWWETYIGAGQSLFLAALPCALLGSPRTRLALAAAIWLFGLVATVEVFGFAHYTAPAACLLYAVIVQAYRLLSFWRPGGWLVGRRLTAVWLSGCVLAPCLGLIPAPGQRESGSADAPSFACLGECFRPWLSQRKTPEWAAARAEFERQRRQDGGRHLVVVRYGEGHSFHEEWVYNEADIDAAPVVWAREMGADGRDRLLAYFKGRTVWLLEEDGDGPRWTLLRPGGAEPAPLHPDRFQRAKAS
jgi:hypothetical protein